MKTEVDREQLGEVQSTEAVTDEELQMRSEAKFLEKYDREMREAAEFLEMLMGEERELNATESDIRDTEFVCGVSTPDPPRPEKGFQWKKMRVTMDSGSHVDVMPSDEMPHIKPSECTGSRKGRRMIAANGTLIREIGEKRIKATTDDGMDVDMTFIAGGVKKALKSIAITCDAGNGHWVIHTSRGGWVVDVKTKRKMAFAREGNSYVLDLWVKVPTNVNINSSVNEVAEGFSRPGAP